LQTRFTFSDKYYRGNVLWSGRHVGNQISHTYVWVYFPPPRIYCLAIEVGILSIRRSRFCSCKTTDKKEHNYRSCLFPIIGGIHCSRIPARVPARILIAGWPRSGFPDLGRLRVSRETQSAARAAQSAPGSCRHDASLRDRSSCDPDGEPRRVRKPQRRASCGAMQRPMHSGSSQ